MFVELKRSPKFFVGFSFINILYKKMNSVAMDSPIGLALTNIFVGCYEGKPISETGKPPVYFRYVEVTFVIFYYKPEVDDVLTTLNCLHGSLK